LTAIPAWAAYAPDEPLKSFTFDTGPLGPEEVELLVEHCAICRTDINFIDSAWSPTVYPLVPGHEAVGRVVAVGSNVKSRRIGERVGVGFYAGSCAHCRTCLQGDYNLCASRRPTMAGRHGAFAARLRADWMWCIPIPNELDPAEAAPLMCGGIAVFSPFLAYNVRPIDRVGVVGIGGLGHIALKIARAWGCHVTAFTSNEAKSDELREFGAHDVISMADADPKKLSGLLDFLIVTSGVPLELSRWLGLLGPKGRLHIAGITTAPVSFTVRPDLISWQRSISGISNGTPSALNALVEFAARHRIAPKIERFPMRRINEAIAHVRSGKARYRVVLDCDF
jgi:uncharacterized zinc-type alcohol dehydrogenase-like protein